MDLVGEGMGGMRKGRRLKKREAKENIL